MKGIVPENGIHTEKLEQYKELVWDEAKYQEAISNADSSW